MYSSCYMKVAFTGEGLQNLNEKLEEYSRFCYTYKDIEDKKYSKYFKELHEKYKDISEAPLSECKRIRDKYKILTTDKIERKTEEYCRKYNIDINSKRANDYKKYYKISRQPIDMFRTDYFAKYFGYTSEQRGAENIIDDIDINDNITFIEFSSYGDPEINLINSISSEFNVSAEFLINSPELDLFINTDKTGNIFNVKGEMVGFSFDFSDFFYSIPLNGNYDLLEEAIEFFPEIEKPLREITSTHESYKAFKEFVEYNDLSNSDTDWETTLNSYISNNSVEGSNKFTSEDLHDLLFIIGLDVVYYDTEIK